jgi:hypothetical protein
MIVVAPESLVGLPIGSLTLKIPPMFTTQSGAVGAGWFHPSGAERRKHRAGCEPSVGLLAARCTFLLKDREVRRV